MDAHALNERYLGPANSRLVHVLLPRTFLAHYSVPQDDTLNYTVYTRFVETGGASRGVRISGRFVLRDSNNACVSRTGLALSLPLVSHGGNLNAFDIAVLRIGSANAECDVTICFLYLELLSGLGLERVPTDLGPKADPVASKVRLERPLDELVDLVHRQQISAVRVAGGPLEVLTGLLKHRGTREQATHHLALEAPGVVRGECRQLPQIAERRPVPALVALTWRPLEQVEPEARRAVRHVFSGNTYYVWSYGETSPREHATRTSPVIFPDPTTTDILQLVFADQLFLLEKQDGFVNSLEAACRRQNYTLRQKLPVTIPNDPGSVDAIKECFAEACIVLRCLAAEQAAWVRAVRGTTVSQRPLWLDVLGLWETGHHCLGTMLCDVGGDESEPNWPAVIKHPSVKGTICGDLTACVVVSANLHAWLVLPGGVVIKGQYDVSEEDLELVRSRYV
ncbi:ORF32 [Retroperitoneal fibromatosis-associated herpesvirus]|uniref:ORF32 n=1 Tax=Retroperitoneal fibromatosis-associated herpesvirus TaxID=111469 RepID=U5NIV9_9GAMA|nr:ORF32 [Retroperitoneal fibromatosis-associated herpesvirus]AGY30714.1 ORF32 [Retroperitoneal fibromatosis-associated herpesvirus]